MYVLSRMHVCNNSSTNTHRKKRKSVTVPASLKASTNSSSVAESLYFPQQMKHFRNMTCWLPYYWTQPLISAHHNKPPLYGTKMSPPFPRPRLIVGTQSIKIENKINKSSEGLKREKSPIKLEPVIKSRWHHMWVEFDVGSLLCLERFYSWYSGFPHSSKNQHDHESGRRRTTLWMCYI